jgi:hypothetical protein
MRQASFSERLHYKVDTFLARGSGALFLSLVVVFVGSILFLVILRLVLGLFAPESADVLSHLWTVFLELTDPGSMGEDSETPTIFKIAAIVSGFTGVVIFSSLIAFLTSALEQAIDALKRGESKVLEKEHTLILGWSHRVVEILRELVIANESESSPVIVILSEEEKETMDEYLRETFPDRKNTKIVTRSGSTSSLLALTRVAVADAKSAIVLATAGEGTSADERAASDARAIKTVLAIIASVPDRHQINVVAEVFDPRNRDVVKDIDPARISVIDAQEILAKIMVQTSRTTGLAVVYSELLGFAGSEMYFHNNPSWAGLTFGQVQFHFPDGVPIGVRQRSGALEMRPDIAYAMAADDEILIIAEDDSSIAFQKSPVIAPADIPLKRARIAPRAERQLVLGWSSKAATIIGEYSDYVLQGSIIDVMMASPSPEVVETVNRLNGELETIQVTLIDKDPLDVDELEAVKPFGYNNVIILPQTHGEDVDPEQVDAETLIVLLHLRKLQAKLRAQGYERFGTKIITEVLDSQNQELITRAGVDDFIISNRLVSMFLAQISEEPAVQTVYEDLFQEEGSEIYVKPAWLYAETLPITCRFADLMRLAQLREGEVCIGYKLKALEDDSSQNFGVKINPAKDAQLTITTDDALVVVAEDDR